MLLISNPMVENRDGSDLNDVFFALSDPTRRGILARLTEGELPVSELARPLDMSLPAVSKHLQVLRRARLVRQTKIGRVRLCALNPLPLREAAEWIGLYRGFWEQRLDALAEYLNEIDEEEPSN